MLIRDPILQEKRLEHVSFQKYALELLERLSGRTKQINNDFSLINIHRANVVAQTKIQFNDRQLLQLIYQHLVSKGLVDSATLLQREANLSLVTNNSHLPSKFRYATTPVTPNRVIFYVLFIRIVFGFITCVFPLIFSVIYKTDRFVR